MRSNPNIRLNGGKRGSFPRKVLCSNCWKKYLDFFLKRGVTFSSLGVLILKSSVNKTKNGTNEKAPVSFSNWRIRSIL